MDSASRSSRSRWLRSASGGWSRSRSRGDLPCDRGAGAEGRDRRARSSRRAGCLRDVEAHRAVERRDLELRPAGGERRGHVDEGDEIVAVTDEALVLRDADQDVQVARRPPRSPTWPRPVTRMRWPSAMPAGTSTSMSARWATLPRPSQVSHGCSGTRPSPSQTSQTAVRTIWPNAVRVTACTWPAPPQREQVRIGVPGFAPLPLQVSQRAIAS